MKENQDKKNHINKRNTFSNEFKKTSIPFTSFPYNLIRHNRSFISNIARKFLNRNLDLFNKIFDLFRPFNIFYFPIKLLNVFLFLFQFRLKMTILVSFFR